MARIFISHSSHDKAVARKLVDDLRALGHEPWLDEYDIRVGDSIPGKIEEGLQNADFVAVLLSPAAVQSGWVDREWKAKYWAEVLADRVMVLPVLLEDCEIPLLLGPKKYADLRNYAVGLVQLIGAIDPSLSPVAGPPVVLQTPPAADEVAKLIAKIQSRAVPLSQCLAEALQLAIKLKDQSLQSLCNHELRGWKADTKPDDTPNYRKIEMFLSPTPINMNYLGFGGSASAALSYMQRSKDYKAFSMVVGEPISQIEARPPSDPDKGLLSVTLKWSDVQDNAPQPNATLYAYAPGDSYAEVLERIRTELTAQLLNLLPSVGQPQTAERCGHQYDLYSKSGLLTKCSCRHVVRRPDNSLRETRWHACRPAPRLRSLSTRTRSPPPDAAQSATRRSLHITHAAMRPVGLIGAYASETCTNDGRTLDRVRNSHL